MLNLLDEARKSLDSIIVQAYKRAVAEGRLPSGKDAVRPMPEVPKDSTNGDFATGFALANAKTFGKAPRIIAGEIVSCIKLEDSYFSSVSVAGPGFINFTLSSNWRKDALSLVDELGGEYGKLEAGNGQKVMVEFVSANPTGPMHLGNARGGVLGDTLANVMERAGYDVTREFYINDAGNQIDLFGRSLEARYIQHFKGEEAAEFPEDGYKGDYVRDTAADYAAEFGYSLLDASPEERRKALSDYGVEKNILRMKEDLYRYGVEFDVWFRESTLHNSGAVKDTIDLLINAGHTYEKDGAIWFRATDFGLEKDEVMVRSNGFYTYFAVDIAYHYNKFAIRNFDRVIDIFGADHHGHTLRFKAGMEALSIDPGRLQFMLMQLVRLLSGKEVVRMSKRTGQIITLSNLLDEISVDAARFFFNSRQADTHLEFDLDLAIREDNDNPVYYVQYAHARICTMLSLFAEDGIAPKPWRDIDVSLLDSKEELRLIKSIAEFPEEISLAVRDLDPTRIVRYMTGLASEFHSFYNACRIRGSEEGLLDARLKLADTTRAVFKNALGLMRIGAPESM